MIYVVAGLSLIGGIASFFALLEPAKSKRQEDMEFREMKHRGYRVQ